MQYRGFGSLHSRMLLAQQYDIEVLERELDTIDKWDENEGDRGKLGCKERDDLYNRKEKILTDFPHARTRPELLAELKQQVMDYGESDARCEACN